MGDQAEGAEVRLATHWDLLFRNGQTFPLRGEPPTRYPTATEFRVEPAQLGGRILLEAHSSRLGFLTPFECWYLHEADVDWMIGTAEDPSFEADQLWSYSIYADGRFVYVQFGDGDLIVHTWYRVFLDDFVRAWREGVALGRTAVPTPLPPTVWQLRKARRRKRASTRG